jgi:hypothetical protein
MRADRRARPFACLVAGLLVLGGGCAIRLDDPPTGDDRDAGAIPQLPSCAPLAGAVERIVGRLVWVPLPDGRTLVVAGQVTVGGETDSRGLVLGAGGCLAGATLLPARPIVDLSGTPVAGDHAEPLGAVTTAAGAFLYFTAAHPDGLAADGLGVARWNEAAGRFSDAVILWTADRPSYGSGAAADAGTVYVYGGLPGGFLAADMFIARVPADRLAVPGAYEYWHGGGNWDPDPDLALPFAEGGMAPSVTWDAQRARWLLAYATPLATELSVRAGLGPSGPWSLPVTLGRCALPPEDPGSFCGDVTLPPSLPSPGASTDADELLMAQAIGALDRPAGLSEDVYATRLVNAAWPAALP